MTDLTACEVCGAALDPSEYYGHIMWHEELDRRLTDLEVRLSNGPF